MMKNKRMFILSFISFVFITLMLFSFYAPAYAAQSIILKPGFNFISFIEDITMTPAQFKALSPFIEDIYLYSPDAGSFLSFGEGSLSRLSAGKGYIIKSYSANNVTISVPGSALAEVGNIALKSGFNLVGFSKMPESLKATALMARNSKIKGVYKWNAAASSFVQVVRNASGAAELLDGIDIKFNAGEACFINMSEGQQLNYDGATVLIDTNVTPLPIVPSMKFILKFGSRGTGTGQFAQGPINVAVDGLGNILASDTYNHRIHKFTSNGVYISSFGAPGSDHGYFNYPTGIAIGKNNYVYVVDYGNARIQCFDSSGKFLSSFGSRGTGNAQFQKPDCVAVDSSGNIYVSDFGNNNIQKFNYLGSYISKFGGAGTGNGQFGADSPKDIAVSPAGKIYAADLGNNRIQVFNSAGIYESQWGSYGSGAGQFDRPHGVAVDSVGDIYISDKNCRVQKFNPSGAFILSVGGKGMLDGQFDDPSGICLDPSGNLLVADFGNARVQIFGSGAPVPGGDVLSEIILSKVSDGVNTGSFYNIAQITVTAKYTNGKTKAVTSAWSVKSGGGSISQNNYKAPSTAGFNILTASYSENGVTKTADLLLSVNQTSDSSQIYAKDIAAVSEKLSVIDKNNEIYISSVESDKVIFNSSAPAVKNLSAGSIIIGGVSTAAPDGYIRKVVSVVSSGSTSVVNTAPASLEEAITDGSFNVNRKFSPADVDNFEPYLPGVELGPIPAAADYRNYSPQRAGAIDFNFPSLKINTDIDLSGALSGLKLGIEGNIALQPSVDYDFNFTGGTKIKIVPKLNAAADLTYNLSKGIEVENKTVITKKARLGKFHLAKTIIWVPTPAGGLPIPIVLTSDLVIYSMIKGSISGGFSLIISAAVETENGFEYYNGFVTPRTARTFSGSISTAFKAGYELESSVGAEIGLYLYGITGPVVNLEIYQQTSGGVQFITNSTTEFYKWWSDVAGVRSAIAGKFDMFARTYDISLNLFDVKGYERSSPVLKSIVLDPASASLTASNTFELSSIKVYGVYDNKWIDFFVNKSFESTSETNLNFVADNYLLIKYRTSWKIISGGGSIGIFDRTYTRAESPSDPVIIEASFSELTKDGPNAKTARLTLKPSSKVSTPAFKTTGNPSDGPQTITITCATQGAVIKYTTDGTTPSATNGVIYSAPFVINKTTTVKAFAYKTAMSDSAVAQRTFTVNSIPEVYAPVIAPGGGAYSAVQSVKITCATAGATIRYTINGTNPTITNGFTYSTPITVDSTKTIKAYAYKDGMTDSPIVTAFFDMSGLKVATPVLNPNGGTFSSARLVSLSCATAGATIMYTRDGSNPSATNGLSYNPIASPSGITIDKTCTLKVIAVKSGMSASDIVSAYFVISGSTSTKVATPVITPGSGTYSSAKSISLSCSTSGATIKYTTNGTTPSPTNGNTYTGAFTVSSTTTVKAMAYKSGITNSDVASAIITISSPSGAFSITLRPNSTSTALGNGITLDRVDLIVNYSNGTGMETGAWKGIIPPPESGLPARGTGSWSKISGSGSFTTDSFNGYIYKPSAKGTHVLKFSYTEGGVTKTADFTISVN